jgi:HlyD family secretion protein
MTANAEIVIKDDKGVLSVPTQALVYDAEKNASVFVPDAKQKDGQRKVAVKISITNGSRTEITDGLKEGDTVVLQQ